MARTLGMGVVLVLCMVSARTSPLFCWDEFCGREGTVQALWGAVADLVYVAGATVLCTLALLLIASRPRALTAIRRAFSSLAIISVVAAFANPVALRELGHPLTYQWLFYSDLLLSIDTYNSLTELLSWSLAVRVSAGLAAVLLGGPLLGRRLARHGMVWPGHRAVLGVAAVGATAVAVTASLYGRGTAFLQRPAMKDVRPEELDYHNLYYEFLTGVPAVKPVGAGPE